MENIVVTSSAGFVPTYSADFEAGVRRISIRRFEGTFASFADSDANFTFSDDGRLKSINQTTTGQGETIIKSLVSLGTTVAGFGAHIAEAGKSVQSACDIVRAWAGSAKPAPTPTPSPSPTHGPATQSLPGAADAAPAAAPGPTPTPSPSPTPSDSKLPSITLTYTAELSASSTERFASGTYAFKEIGAARAVRQQLGSLLPRYQLIVGRGFLANHPESQFANLTGPYVNLELQTVAVAELTIKAASRSQKVSQPILFKGNLFVPTPQSYYLPIPTAALFGTQSLTLAVADSGLVTQIDYAKKTGLAGAANAANSIVTALTPESAGTKASDLKAQADVLAQQARLHRCLASPATCQ
jgi:hypothetical protein